MHSSPPKRRPTAAPGQSDQEDLVRGRQVIVVSNRQPYRHEYENGRLSVDRPTGGLTAALDPVMQSLGGTWIAWGDGDGDPDAVDADGSVGVPPGDPSYRLRRVWLSSEAVGGYYDGFSNQVIWPACHGALTNVRCAPGYWEQYRRVNERFAEAVIEQAGADPIVWFHDYHLALAPADARRALPAGADLLQFWHIPWPAWDTFRACPHGRRLLEGLLETDVLGFHLPRYRRNFLGCVEADLDAARVDWETGTVRHGGTDTRVEAIPMGVPVDRIGELAESTPDGEPFDLAAGIAPSRRLAVGVDRLDYTKGILERLRALEHLWETRPRWRGALTYVQIGSESRTRVPAYREIQTAIAAAIDRINDRFGTDDWRPIVDVTRRLSQAQLYRFYRRADVAIVSPIRDGMNLVAQEYVAAQSAEAGVLVLSDQTGVHDLLGEAAVSVVPTDVAGFADAIERALVMGRSERRRRMRELLRLVTANDLSTWLRGILEASPGGSTRDQPVGQP